MTTLGNRKLIRSMIQIMQLDLVKWKAYPNGYGMMNEYRHKDAIASRYFNILTGTDNSCPMAVVSKSVIDSPVTVNFKRSGKAG